MNRKQAKQELTLAEVGGMRAISRLLGVAHTTLIKAIQRNNVEPIVLGDGETYVYEIEACRNALDTKGPAGRKRKSTGEAT